MSRLMTQTRVQNRKYNFTLPEWKAKAKNEHWLCLTA